MSANVEKEMEAGEHTQVGELCQGAEEACVGVLPGDGEVVVVKPQGAPAAAGNAVTRKLGVDSGEVSPSMLLPQVGQKALFNRFFKNVLDEKNKDSCVCVCATLIS